MGGKASWRAPSNADQRPSKIKTSPGNRMDLSLLCITNYLHFFSFFWQETRLYLISSCSNISMWKPSFFCLSPIWLHFPFKHYLEILPVCKCKRLRLLQEGFKQRWDLARWKDLYKSNAAFVNLVIFGLFEQGTLSTHVNYDGRISFRELHSNLLNAFDVKSQSLH